MRSGRSSPSSVPTRPRPLNDIADFPGRPCTVDWYREHVGAASGRLLGTPRGCVPRRAGPGAPPIVGPAGARVRASDLGPPSDGAEKSWPWLPRTVGSTARSVIAAHFATRPVPEGEAPSECPDCGIAYNDNGGIQVESVYVRMLALLRDVEWAVAIHGMNTKGAWQGEFQLVFRHDVGSIRAGRCIQVRNRRLRCGHGVASPTPTEAATRQARGPRRGRRRPKDSTVSPM